MQTFEELDTYLPHRGRITRLVGEKRSDSPQAVMSPAPAKIEDGGSVTLTVSYQNWDPTPDDFITVSCGPTQGLDDFLDSVALLDAAAQVPVQITFTNLVYMRCDYQFVYVGVTYYPNVNYTALGFLTVPSVDHPDAPKQGHLAYLNDPTTMMVQYVSGAASPAPSVRLGPSAQQLTTVFHGTSKTYTNADLCHDPANSTAQQWFRNPGFMHSVLLTGLVPDAVYYYQYGNDAAGWSPLFSFRAAPKTARGVRFVAYGDQDIVEPSVNTSRFVSMEATQRGLDFVVHFGDLGYALGNAWRWDAWGSLVADGASRVPYMVSVGNHEFDYSGGQEHDPSHTHSDTDGSFAPDWWNNGPTASRGECGVPVYYRFAAPSNGNGVFWYAFRYGNMFLVQLSSEHNFTQGSEQWLWLDKTLAGVDRTATPWVVVTLHRPIYSTQECETGDYVVGLHLRRALDPLFEKYEVDVALVAHTHAYERTCPLKGGMCVGDGEGTVHLTVGSAGAGLEGCGYSPKFGNFSRAHVNTWGYLRGESSDSHIHLQFVLDADGTVFDEYFVQRRK